MAKHNKIGIKGEQIAEGYLLNKGYIILHKNWRSGNKEIDIIASTGDILAIVEIKTRSKADLAFPEESVNKKKQQFLKAAAASFAEQYPDYINIRFDIISILLSDDSVKEIVHFEGAYS